MNIDSIKNGIVLDHIRAGRGMQIYNSLGLDQLDCSVAIIKNVKSRKKGRILQTTRYGLLIILEINSSVVPDFVPAPAFPEDLGQCTQSLFWLFELP